MNERGDRVLVSISYSIAIRISLTAFAFYCSTVLSAPGAVVKGFCFLGVYNLLLFLIRGSFGVVGWGGGW